MQPYPSHWFKYFFHYMGRYKKYLAGIFICMSINVFITKISPYFLSKIIDVLSDANTDKSHIWESVLVLLLIVFALEGLYLLVRRVSAGFFIFVEPDFAMRIRTDATEYILNHSLAYLNDQQSGKLSARVDQIKNYTRNLFWTMTWGFSYPFITMLVTLSLLAWVNIWIAVLFFFWVCVLLVILYATSFSLQKLSADNSDKSSKANGGIIDSITNAATVKGFANFNYEKSILYPLLEDEKMSDRAVVRKIETNKVYQILTVSFISFTMMVLMIYLWQQSLITAGEIVYVLFLTMGISEIFKSFIYELMHYHRSVGGLENALKVISIPHQVQDIPGAKKLRVGRGGIVFDHVNFTYHDAKSAVFKNFSISIKPGEKVGLVGISGSGKTTLINLLQRFYDIKSGHILIDGQDISQVTQESLHQNISIIPQDTALFHRSLRENIKYGNPKAGEKEIVAATKKAYAYDFIMQSQNGYDTLVGERGIKLSGGQRQRIAIARAILKNAPILILDEATSALDSESEKYIQDSIKKIMRGKTVIAIAHRLSTLKEMDRIIVMSKGRILEQGPPAMLLKKNGKYAKLWKMQTQLRDKDESGK